MILQIKLLTSLVLNDVTILFDEMKVQEDLVWDKYSGELMGFVDLEDIQTNYAALKNVRELASYVLVFHVKSIVNPLSYSLATFATTGVTSTQLMSIFWKAVRYLESVNLKVIAATADGASPNRKFFKMHKEIRWWLREKSYISHYKLI